MGLKSALQKLDAAVKDLSSLHVQTYSGIVNFQIKEGQQTEGDKQIEAFDNLRDKVVAASGGTTQVAVDLMAETLIKFDGDSYNFLARENLTDEILKLHKDAVEAGVNIRQGLFEMLKGIF